jgi:hypothetical protein
MPFSILLFSALLGQLFIKTDCFVLKLLTPKISKLVCYLLEFKGRAQLSQKLMELVLYFLEVEMLVVNFLI